MEMVEEDCGAKTEEIYSASKKQRTPGVEGGLAQRSLGDGGARMVGEWNLA